jgi:hypothetical protein
MLRRGQFRRPTRSWALVALAIAVLGLLARAILGIGDHGAAQPMAPDEPIRAQRQDSESNLTRAAAVGSSGTGAGTDSAGGPERATAPQALRDGPPGHLRFRVLTPDGEPAIQRLVARGSWLEHALALEPDSAGRCLVDLADRGDDGPTGRSTLPAPGSPVTMTIIQTAVTGRRRAPGDATLGPSVAASFAWPEAGRDLDLGVLLLVHAPVIVGGRLLGPDGTAISPNGAVRWSVQELDATGSVSREMTEGDAFYAVIGEDGEFALYGPPAAGPGLRLSLRDDVQQTFEPVTTGSGRRDFDVNLIPTSRIQARLQVRGPVRPDHITVTVVDGQDPAASWPGRVRTVWRDMPAWTSLLVIDVKPGSHHVVFSHDGTELLRLSHVPFPAGRASEDPRLTGLEIVTR